MSVIYSPVFSQKTGWILGVIDNHTARPLTKDEVGGASDELNRRPLEAKAEAGETLHFVALLEKWKDDPDFLREVEQLAKEWPTARAFPPADPPHGYVRVKGPDGVGTGIVPREAIDQGSKVADPTPAQLEALEKWQEANPGATVFPRNELLREWTEEYRTSDDNYEPPEPDMNADGPAERDHRADEARRMK